MKNGTIFRPLVAIFGVQSHRVEAPERHRALLLVSVVDPHGGAVFLKRRGAVFVTSRDGFLWGHRDVYSWWRRWWVILRVKDWLLFDAFW